MYAWLKTIIIDSSCRGSLINLAFIIILSTVFIPIAGTPIVGKYPTVSLVTVALLLFLVIKLNPIKCVSLILCLWCYRRLRSVPTFFLRYLLECDIDASAFWFSNNCMCGSFLWTNERFLNNNPVHSMCRIHTRPGFFWPINVVIYQ